MSKGSVIIVGGGMAGMSAAQAWHEQGYRVTLFEQYFCGSQASGKSSGFITPESELNLSHFQRLVGTHSAQAIWDFGISGCELIKHNIERYKLNCDYKLQDSCVAANTPEDMVPLKQEHELRTQLGYRSTLVPKQDMQHYLATDRYHGALISYDTFGINSYQYVQAMKFVLIQQGVQIFELTPVTAVHTQGVTTTAGHFTADYLVLCVDRFLPQLHLLQQDVYHAQNFIALSKPLSSEQLKQIFAQPLMVWDTDLLYAYYRIVADNRLLIGGSDYVAVFWGSEQPHNRRIPRKLAAYVHDTFKLSLDYEYVWPGLIGVSKDLMPLAGYDPAYPHIYCIGGAAGLPWAAALGKYSATRLTHASHDIDHHFSPQRKFPLPSWAQWFLGKRLTFGLSNLMVELS